MLPQTLNFNLNQKVKVRLTSSGVEYLKKRHARLFTRSYSPPKVDKQGYSTWQLWDLMGVFGECLQYPTIDPPFDPDILLILDS